MLQVLRSHVVSEFPSLGDPICVHVDSEEWFVGIHGYLKRKKFPDRVDVNAYIRIRKLFGCYLGYQTKCGIEGGDRLSTFLRPT